MSLQFSEDPLSKREKQERFKRSLDDQRRLKQEASHQQPQLPSNAGNQGYHVPGLSPTLPDAADVSARINRIPGLDQPQAGSSRYAPRYECSPSPQQEKQPYMSAVSMNTESTAHKPLFRYLSVAAVIKFKQDRDLQRRATPTFPS